MRTIFIWLALGFLPNIYASAEFYDCVTLFKGSIHGRRHLSRAERRTLDELKRLARRVDLTQLQTFEWLKTEVPLLPDLNIQNTIARRPRSKSMVEKRYLGAKYYFEKNFQRSSRMGSAQAA